MFPDPHGVWRGEQAFVFMDMKRIGLILTLVAVTMTVRAQLTSNGFYRVKNYGTGNYFWVCDNTGSISYATTSADMAAIQLRYGLDNAVSAPASVLYFENKGGDYWDITSQGTGVYKIIGRYVDISFKGAKDGLSFYEVSATESGVTLYLSDSGSWGGGDFNTLGTTGKGTARRWLVEPIDATTDCYFGVEPGITVTSESGKKYYAPFYADFAFSFASTGMKAYYVSKVDGNIAVLSEVQTEVIPASTPVIIECSSADKSDNRLTLLAGTYSPISGNALKGVYFCNEFREESKDAITAFDASSMRVWGVNAEGALTLNSSTSGLHENWWGDDENRYLNANQSYLPVAAGTAAEMILMTETEYAEYAKIAPYDLNGDCCVDMQDVSDLYNVIESVSDADSKYDINSDGVVDTQDALLIYEVIKSR